MKNSKRPISPHLSIYRPQISSVTSIMHRITGFTLYILLVCMVWSLAVLFYCSHTVQNLSEILSRSEALHVLSQIFLATTIFTVFYHFLNGIRHLAWDGGYGYKIKTVRITGVIVILASLLLTSLFCCLYLF